MQNLKDKILVQEFRGGIAECSHRGHICIVNERGEVVKHVGNPHAITFTRSSAKPFQAIPGIRAGIKEAFGLTDEEIAIMTSSHRSEPIHIAVLESLVAKLGLREEQLICAPSWPQNEETKERLLRKGAEQRRLYHNCSGKHLGVLAYCKMMGYPLEGYYEAEHPVQQEIIDIISKMGELQREDVGLGTDGCGFPVFALPLSALAKAYMKLACPDRIDDVKTASAVRTVTDAMQRNPLLVGGTGRLDSIMLKDDNIVAKGGFKGIFCFGLKKERLGVAFKVSDGSEEEWGVIVQKILEVTSYDNSELLARLRAAVPEIIRNDAGDIVGHWEVVFTFDH